MFDTSAATARLVQLSDASREALNEAVSTVAEGRAPTNEGIESIHKVLKELRDAYDDIRMAATSIPGLPLDEELPASMYIEALEADEARRAREALAPIIALLEKFVSVTSDRQTFAEALRPSQDEARTVLDLLRGNDPTPAEISLEPDGSFVMPKRLFIDALNREDLADDEGMSLIDSLGEFYPSRVGQGLMMHQYHLPEGQGVDAPANEPLEAKPMEVEPKPTSAPEKNAAPTSQAPAPSPLLKKKIGVKALRRDLLEIVSHVPRAILSLTAVWPGLTPPQAVETFDIFNLHITGCDDENVVSKAFESLTRKGYLEKVVESASQQYRLTSNTVELMQKESAISLRDPLGRPAWPVKLPGDPETSDEVSRFSIRERLTRCSEISPKALSASYDLAITYLRYVQGHYKQSDIQTVEEHALGKAPIEMIVIWDGAEIRCALAPEGNVSKPKSGSILSDTTPGPDVDVSTYEHWFVLDEDGMSDALAGSDEATDNTSEPTTPAELQEVIADEPPAQAERPVPTQSEDKTTSENTSSSSSHSLAQELFARSETPTDEEARQFINLLFSDPRTEDITSPLATALAFLKSLAQLEDHPWSRRVYRQLILACDSGIERHAYTGDELNEAFPTLEPSDEGRLLAASCQAMLAPQLAYDHQLHNTCATYMDSFEEIFPSFAVAKPLYRELLRIWDASPDHGLDRSVIAAIGGEERRSEIIAELKTRARKLCSLPKVKAKISSIPDFLGRCFGKASDLGMCMGIIADDRRDEAELVKATLEDYLAAGTDQLDEEALADTIDDAWRESVSNTKKNHKGMQLRYEARKQVDAAFIDRLETMQEWIRYTERPVDDETLGKLRSLRNNLSQIIDETQNAGAELPSRFDAAVFEIMLRCLKAKLAGEKEDVIGFQDFLLTGYVSLRDGLPVLEDEHAAILYCEPWRRVLHHAATGPQDPHEACARTLDPESDSFDNYTQLNDLIKTFGPFPEVSAPSATDQRRAKETAEEDLKRFIDELEMAYAYNKIDEVQKERLADTANINKEHFFELGDFANWRRFLRGLREQIDDLSSDQRLTLGNRIAACKERLGEKDLSSLLITAEELFEKGNYAVAEEYLNRLDSGKRDVETSAIGERDDFSEFISDETYRTLYDFCTASRNQGFAKPAQAYLNDHAFEKWTTRQRDSAKELVKAWPGGSSRPRTTDASSMTSLLRALGFSIRKPPNRVSDGYCHYKVEMRPTERNLPHYSHPIAAFGTQLAPTIDVLVLFGSNSPQEIMLKVVNEKMTAMSIVILDFPMRLEDRRQLAELFHAQSNHVQFIVIDRVLALYLALHEQAERIPLMLKCSLPFTYYQPFVRDGGPTPDEMFCGRDKELDSILDPGGACVVYGGRQLGKTALLQRAESLRQKPADRCFAIYVNIIQCTTEAEVAAKIAEGLKAKAQLDIGEPSTLQELCNSIAALMRGDISQLLLLLDECDRFLSAISEDAYAQLQPLVDLKRETMNKFKFVIAGLHNVCRAKNATENNGIFGQLGSPVCVKPLSPLEALQLISRPLMFLGFQVDRYPHLETILTNTNYYPGIIQFFGHILVESMKGQYGRYYRAVDGHPPYPLREEQLGAIISQNDLNNSIKEKFRWSLELDRRYFMLARCIAMLYYEAEQGEDQLSLLDGFSVSAIQKCANECDISCLKSEDIKSLTLLLDEMVEMGILAKPNADERCYKLRRRSFLNIIGPSDDAILEDIIADEEASSTGTSKDR